MMDRLVPLSLPLSSVVLPDKVARKLAVAEAAGMLPAYGVVVLEQAHDAWCAHWAAQTCTCDPDVIAHWWSGLLWGVPGVKIRCP